MTTGIKHSHVKRALYGTMLMINKPFLLLRGLTREQRHWGNFVEILQQHFPGTEIITLDIPGNGRLYQLESPKTISNMTEALREQLDKTCAINVIALSMGGMIALDWMNRYPEEISAGVLINSSAGNLSPFYRRLRWQTYFSVLKMLRQSPAQQEQTILALTSNHECHNQDLLSAWRLWREQCPVSAASALNQIKACATFKITQKPTHPLLILTSSADQLVDYRCSVKLHQLWRTAFKQHTRAGHDLPLDDPFWVCQAIKTWLES